MDPAAWGALLAGLGSFLAALASIRSSKKKSVGECDQRISEIRDAFQMGMRVQPRDEEDEKWSHLP